MNGETCHSLSRILDIYKPTICFKNKNGNIALKQPLWFEWHIHINLGVKSIEIAYIEIAHILDISGDEVKMKS